MMVIRRGSSGSRITVSLVWKSTSSSPGMSGDADPAAGGDHDLVGGDLLVRLALSVCTVRVWSSTNVQWAS